MATNIIISGALGRMGREIGATVLSDPNARLVGCLEAVSHPNIGKDYGELLGRGNIGIKLSDDPLSLPLSGAVVINFALPDGVDAFLQAIGSRPVPMVVGTTGLSGQTMRRIESLAASAPVVLSPNMCMGVNLLFYLTKLIAGKVGEEFDIEIIEAHHRHKRDAPSGTARRLGEIVCAVRNGQYGRDVKHGRAGITGERPRGEIGMHAVRAGDIVGEHTVLFAAEGERIELRHSAHSRAPFARGAVTAAHWIANRAPGLYSMADVFGLSAGTEPQH